jgi:hypothetical protein
MRYLKLALVVLVISQLFGCVTWKDSRGYGVSRSDEFECKQRCGYYDIHSNVFSNYECHSDCMNAKGYRLERN